MRYRAIGAVVLAGVAALFFVLRTSESHAERDNIPVVLFPGGDRIRVEVVDTPAARRRGLSDRDALAPGTGMLFVFSESARHGIWMKDMRFSLDILWLDELGRVVHEEQHVSPDTYPLIYTPLAPARFVLEVPEGTLERNAVKRGDTVRFECLSRSCK